jgi:hypothetical protein
MTPKENAKQLFDKMYMVDDPMGNYPMCFDTAKQCALIAVDEILNEIPEFFKDSIQTFKGDIKIDVPNCSYDFWKQVKHEIESL